MRAFQKHKTSAICQFEKEEICLLESLLNQLIELLNDQCPCKLAHDFVDDGDDDDVISRLERELSDMDSQIGTAGSQDRVIQRLFPMAYLDDPHASADFCRLTAQAQYDDKLQSARVVLNDLAICAEHGECEVTADHSLAWLKSLNNIRLALAVRLEVDTVEDAESLAELPESDPKAWIYSIYEWLGWAQESLLATYD